MSAGLDEVLTKVWGLPPGRSLVDLAPAWPSPAQLALVVTVKRRAIALGLRLPPIVWRFCTAHRAPGWAIGETDPRDRSRAVIYMRTDITLEQWERALYHECKHASDLGLMWSRRYTVLEFESRAISFADYAMATRG